MHNWVGRELLQLASDVELSAGRHELRSEFEPQGQPDPTKGNGSPGRFQLYIDGNLVGDRDVAYTTPFASNPGALTCGADPGSTVTDDYKTPLRFSGTLHKVTVDSGELIHDPEAELKVTWRASSDQPANANTTTGGWAAGRRSRIAQRLRAICARRGPSGRLP